MDKPPETNKDLLLAIYEQTSHQTEQITALQSDMTTVKRQVEYTNGKVAGLIEDKIKRDERAVVEAEYQRRQGDQPQAQTNIKATTAYIEQPKWFGTPEGRNVLIAIAGLLTAAATILTVRFGV